MPAITIENGENSLEPETMDTAFKGVARNKTGFYIWRIQNMEVVPVPREQYGTFYKGDSYIILSVAVEGEPRGLSVKIKEAKGSLESHIHFWLGSETSQDEAGTAAYKTVELDNLLGGSPVQHRECESHESKLFLTYFKNKYIQYKTGGHKSGFNHVDTTFAKRLLQIKGKHHVRVSEIPIAWSSMNSGDTFILDTGSILFVWLGSQTSRTEQIKGMEYSRKLRDERSKANIVVVNDGNEESELSKVEKEIFDSLLPPGERSQLKTKEEGGQDEVVERQQLSELKLYVCTEEDGTLKVSEVKTGPLSKKDLDTNESYIVDNGAAGIWAWIGKNSSKKERSEAMRNAMGFAKKKELPSHSSVVRVIEGGEPTDFKCLFCNWPQPQATGRVYNKNRIAKTIQTKFDASALYQNKQLAAETQMFDDGSGRVEVWRVNNFDLEPIKKHDMGKFYAGDCYVILYTYKVNEKECDPVIYYWQGQKSTADERGTSALKAVELDDKMNGRAVQVRVVQGKEPAHFMSMFDGKMIIFSGGHAGWGDKSGEKQERQSDNYMLQVRGTNQFSTKAIQVEMCASSLNSNDVFVIFSKKVFIWCGKGSTGDEREMAKEVARLSPRESTMVFEGQEKDAFWTAIGGKTEYSSDKRLQEEETAQPVRLFQISNASGRFSCEEIPDFTQRDLIPDDVMMLDLWDIIYVWIGDGANAQEKKESERLALEYVKVDPAGRDPDTVIYRVKQGCEPPTFTGFFGEWDDNFLKNSKSPSELAQELTSGNEALTVIKQVEENNAQDFSSVQKYPYEKLIVSANELPDGIDHSCREIHLSNEDFENIFKMPYSEFVLILPWKQVQLKKQYKLF